MATAKKLPKKATPAPATKQQALGGSGAPGTSGGGNVTPPGAQPSIPQWVNDLGLPPDVYQNVVNILAQDPQGGADKAMAYIRGTAWYATAYAGINQLRNAGVVSNEADYRAWKAQATQAFQQYYNRAPTDQELLGFANQGYNVNTIAQIGSGHAWAAANSADVQYVEGAFDQGRLTDQQLQTLGEQQAGRDSAFGQFLDQRFQAAKQKMQRLFEGQLATPSQSLSGGRLSAPSLNPNQGNQADIAR